jgi:two-component system cell cycle response regulator DivK
MQGLKPPVAWVRKYLWENSPQMAVEFPEIRVLHVDDDEVTLYVTEKILGKKFKITPARNGIEALHLAHKRTYDVILMDIELGHSMDGTEILEELRKDPLNEDTQVFAVTALGLAEDEDYYLGLGFDRFFYKPIDYDVIAEAIKEVCPAKILGL